MQELVRVLRRSSRPARAPRTGCSHEPVPPLVGHLVAHHLPDWQGENQLGVLHPGEQARAEALGKEHHLDLARAVGAEALAEGATARRAARMLPRTPPVRGPKRTRTLTPRHGRFTLRSRPTARAKSRAWSLRTRSVRSCPPRAPRSPPRGGRAQPGGQAQGGIPARGERVEALAQIGVPIEVRPLASSTASTGMTLPSRAVAPMRPKRSRGAAAANRKRSEIEPTAPGATGAPRRTSSAEQLTPSLPATAGASTSTSMRRGRQRSGPLAHSRSQTRSSATGPRLTKSMRSRPSSTPAPRSM